jgi:hypothetical protein
MQDLGSKKWIGYGYSSYKYNFTVDGTNEGKTYSFYVGYCQNNELRTKKHNLIVEYNPNKVPLENGILKYIFENFLRRNTEVLSVDIAVDLMNVNIQYLIVDKHSKHLKMTYDLGGDNKTVYIGKGDGRVKIYNKARETGQLEKVWTRYELSKQINLDICNIHTLSLNENIPEIYYIINTPIIEDKTLSALFYAVLMGYDINDLSRNYREKLKDIAKPSKIEITIAEMEICVKEYVDKLLQIVEENGNMKI